MAQYTSTNTVLIRKDRTSSYAPDSDVISPLGTRSAGASTVLRAYLRKSWILRPFQHFYGACKTAPEPTASAFPDMQTTSAKLAVFGIPAVLILAAALSASAQYKSVTVSNSFINIVVETNKVAEILTFSAQGGSTGPGISVDGVPIVLTTTSKNAFVSGPATISVFTGVSGKVYCTYRLFENASEQSVVTPSSAVVIPADASGPVEILLESSTDLVSWTAANPGTYGSSTQRRFFRVRAVQH